MDERPTQGGHDYFAEARSFVGHRDERYLGRVTRKYSDGERGYVECTLEERNQRGEVCAPGFALVRFR